MSMHEVKVPNGLMEHFSNTPTMLGKENPEIAKELSGLKWGSKGATGEVSTQTLAWMAEEAGKYAASEGLSTSARKAGEAAAQRFREALPEDAPSILVDGVRVPSSFGLPVYHVRDKSRVVGFLTADRFVPVENVKAELSGKAR